MKSTFRAFDCLLHYGTVAWIAETITDSFWCVSQGRTPEEAIESLKDSLELTARVRLKNGIVPFRDDFATPANTQSRWKKAKLLVQHPNPQVGQDYRFVVSGRWGRQREDYNRDGDYLVEGVK